MDELIGRIYETVTDRRQLAMLAEDLQRDLNAHSSAFVIAEPGRYFLMQSNVSPESADAYNEHLWHEDLWMREFLARRSETVLSGHQMCAYADIAADYRHHVLEKADTYDGLSTRVIDAPGRTASVSLYRSKSQGVFQPEDFRKMRILGPHLKRAFSLQEVFGAMKERSGMLLRLLSDLSCGAFILRPSGEIVAMNDEGQSLVADTAVLRTQRKKLEATHKPTQDFLAAAIREAFETGIPAMHIVDTPRLQSPMMIRVARLDSELSEEVTSTAGGGRSRHFVIVTCNFRQALPDTAADALCRAYDLTSREAEAAILIAEGLEPALAARRMNVKVSTFRSFLKSVSVKMDVNRQPELVARIQSLFMIR